MSREGNAHEVLTEVFPDLLLQRRSGMVDMDPLTPPPLSANRDSLNYTNYTKVGNKGLRREEINKFSKKCCLQWRLNLGPVVIHSDAD